LTEYSLAITTTDWHDSVEWIVCLEAGHAARSRLQSRAARR